MKCCNLPKMDDVFGLLNGSRKMSDVFCQEVVNVLNALDRSHRRHTKRTLSAGFC